MKKQVLSIVLASTLLVGTTPALTAHAGQWSNQNGKWYYYNNSSWVKGWSQIGGQWYYFNSNSEMHTGWFQQENTWYYMNGNGQMVTGTHYIDGRLQNFNGNGEWEFTIEGTRITNERNQFWSSKPKKVIFFDYNYKNISCRSDLMVFGGLQYKLLDEEGNIIAKDSTFKSVLSFVLVIYDWNYPYL